MTNEEKARAYDEALEVMRQWIAPCHTKEQLDTLKKSVFPELKESEDERIREKLIEYHKQQLEKNRDQEVGLFHKDAIDWLEKQKDASKAIETVERIDKYIDENLANAHDMKDSNPDKKYYRGWDDALGKMSGILQDVYSNEKQKEQKSEPVFKVGDKIKLKSEPKYPYREIVDIKNGAYYFDEAVYLPFDNQDNWEKEQKSVVTHGETYRVDTLGTQQVIAGKMPQKSVEWGEEDQKSLNRAINICISDFGEDCQTAKFLKSLPKRFNLQSMQEWSEEDEKDIAHIIRILDDCYAYGKHDLSKTDHENLVNTLKSFRPQPKAELTLLDENIINAAVAFVEQNNHFNYWGGIDKCTVIKALRSLKPHWKPNKDQIEALLNTLHPDDPYYSELKSLYEQLQKL